MTEPSSHSPTGFPDLEREAEGLSRKTARIGRRCLSRLAKLSLRLITLGRTKSTPSDLGYSPLPAVVRLSGARCKLFRPVSDRI